MLSLHSLRMHALLQMLSNAYVYNLSCARLSK
jgi:hypothetical protein